MLLTTPTTRPCTRRGARPARVGDERGYITIATALLLTVFVLMAALALDVAHFYVQKNGLQRAADAAALSGVTHMPNLGNAQTAANEAAQRNGYTTAAARTVTVAKVAGSPRRLSVTVKDANVQTFFGKLFVDHITMQRSATAEYVAKIPLGSAYNAIGTGSLTGFVPAAPASTQNFWLAVSGFCAAKEDGDQVLARWDGTASLNPEEYTCNGSSPPLGAATDNTDYDANGYEYALTIPCSTPGVSIYDCTTASADFITLQAYNAVFDAPVLAPDPTKIDAITLPYGDSRRPSVAVTTSFTVWNVNGTPFDDSDDFAISTLTCTNLTCTPAGACAGWCTVGTIPPGSPAGRYRITVRTSAADTTAWGSNSFSFRAVKNGSWAACDSVTDPTCPSVSGDQSLGVFTNSPSTSAEFFLAQLQPAKEFRGKVIQVELWDPGEGAQSIEILAPGSSTAFPIKYRTWFPGLACCASDGALGWPSPVVASAVDVSGDNSTVPPPWPIPSRKFNKRFNGRKVAIEISVPPNYGLNALGNEVPVANSGWWKIRYNYDAATPANLRADRTTWTVSLVGAPVHLVND